MRSDCLTRLLCGVLSRSGRKLFISILECCKKLGLISFYQPVPWLEIGSSARSNSSFSRWKAIELELDRKYVTAVDVGSDLGFFTFRLGELGIDCLGIDSDVLSNTIAIKIKSLCGHDKASFAVRALTPENIESLPVADIYLCLSVFHHFVKYFGFDHAKQMMKVIMKRTKAVLFFETGQSDEKYMGWSRLLPDMGNMPEEWIEKLLYELGAARAKHLGTFDTHLGGVKRHLFAAFK